ncbi:hypothetical protein CR513_61344, partial [Mucuna pruriens]
MQFQMRDIVELLEGVKLIGCKWYLKPRRNKDNIKRYKTRTLLKRKTLTTKKHFLRLHQMDIKTAFLNGDIDKKRFIWCNLKTVSDDSKFMAFHQWYHKFHQIITSYGFEINVINDCVYYKFNGSKYIFLVLYVNHILLASSNIGLLHETKRFLMKNFEMKDLGETSFVLGIHILTLFLRLSQENYINKVLDRFDMKYSKLGDMNLDSIQEDKEEEQKDRDNQTPKDPIMRGRLRKLQEQVLQKIKGLRPKPKPNPTPTIYIGSASPGDTLIAKGDKYGLNQWPNNDFEKNEKQNIQYASTMGSHWKAVKYVMCYLKRTNG